MLAITIVVIFLVSQANEYHQLEPTDKTIVNHYETNPYDNSNNDIEKGIEENNEPYTISATYPKTSIEYDQSIFLRFSRNHEGVRNIKLINLYGQQAKKSISK